MNIEEFPKYCLSDISSHFQEQIVYIYLNTIRKTSNIHIKDLASQFCELLLFLKQDLSENRYKYIDLVYRLVLHTRDIIGGKGEHDVFYMMIYELHRLFPSLSIYLLHNYVGQSIGCWRDIKYLCNYVRSVSPWESDDSLIYSCIEIVNRQLKKDIESWRFSLNAGSRKHISNIAKWIPREKKRFNWLFEKLAINWCNNYGRWKLEDNNYNYFSALNKCKRQYRKIIARMNKILDTTEIKQCYQLWDTINVDKVSKYTIMKQLFKIADYNFINFITYYKLN
jgi:hypothetical protein